MVSMLTLVIGYCTQLLLLGFLIATLQLWFITNSKMLMVTSLTLGLFLQLWLLSLHQVWSIVISPMLTPENGVSSSLGVQSLNLSLVSNNTIFIVLQIMLLIVSLLLK